MKDATPKKKCSVPDPQTGMPSLEYQGEAFAILLIEDDADLAKTLEKSLQARNYTLDWGDSIARAQNLAKSNVYELMLLSINFDQDAGLYLIPWLQFLQPQAKIITMTDLNPKEVEEKVRTFRVIYHLIKPFSLQELVHIIDHLFMKYTHEQLL